MHRLTAVAALLLVAQASSAADLPVNAPDSVCVPTFQLATGSNSAGTGFLLESPNSVSPTVLVTAHHLFGPDGGVAKQISCEELPSFVWAAKCESISHKYWSVGTGRPSAVKHAKSYVEQGPRRDIAIFLLKPASYPALRLATADPEVDDTVWLVSKVRSGAGPQVLLHMARVDRATPEEVVYFYENSSLNLSGTSGAPIVNKAGLVVGVNYGAVRNKDGRLLGFATGRGALADSLASVK